MGMALYTLRKYPSRRLNELYVSMIVSGLAAASRFYPGLPEKLADMNYSMWRSTNLPGMSITKGSLSTALPLLKHLLRLLS